MNHLSRAFTSSTVPRLAGLRSKSGCQKNIFMERFSRTAVLFSRSSRRWFSSSDKEDSPTSTKKIVTKQPPKLSKREREILASLRLSSPQLAKKTSTTSPKVVDSTSRDIGAEIKELRKAKTSSSAHQCDFIPQALAVHHTNCLQNLILKNSLGESPLTIALLAKDTEYALKLIEEGADVNWFNAKGSTPLHLCCNSADMKVFKALLAKGADINATDSVGHTPLHLAVTTDSSGEMVRELISRGADVNAQTDEGHSPIHYAATHANEIVFEMLLNAPKIDLELLDRDSNTVLHHLANDARDDLIPLLLQKNKNLNLHLFNIAGSTPIHLAAQSDSVGCVEALLNAGANPNVAEADGTTALLIAAAKGNLEMLQLLHRSGADLFCKTLEDEWSALHAAAQEGHTEAVSYLLRNGLQPDLQNEEGTTALHLAVDGGHEKTAIELLKFGADANRSSHLTGSAVHQAAQDGRRDILLALIQHGADINAVNAEGLTPLHLALASEHEKLAIEMMNLGADVNIATIEGVTAAHVAAQEGQLDALKALSLHHADLNKRSKYGTPFRFARENEHDECVEFLRKMLGNQNVEQDDELPN